MKKKLEYNNEEKNRKNDNLDTPTEDNSSDFFKIKKRQKKDNK